MGIFRLKRRRLEPGVSGVTGRAYFRRAAQKLNILGLDPVAIQSDLEPLPSKQGSRKSRVGGRIAWNLQHLSPEETVERAQRSERFLKQRPIVFAAEEKSRPER